MKTESSKTASLALAASVAPEDLECGDFVAILSEISEFPSFFWFDTSPDDRDKLVRLRFIPKGSGRPLKIKAICLPFVAVKPPVGQCETIDVRQTQLARLDERYAKHVRKKLRAQHASLLRKSNKKIPR